MEVAVTDGVKGQLSVVRVCVCVCMHVRVSLI